MRLLQLEVALLGVGELTLVPRVPDRGKEQHQRGAEEPEDEPTDGGTENGAERVSH